MLLTAAIVPIQSNFFTSPNYTGNSQATAQAYLGLGTAATQNTGTFFQTANNLNESTPATVRANVAVPGLAVNNTMTGNQTFKGGGNDYGSPEGMTSGSIDGGPPWGGAGGGAVRMYFMGNPAYQDSGESTYDAQLIFYAMNTWTSGSGTQMPLLGTNGTIPGAVAIGTNSSGVIIYNLNKAAMSIVTVPMQAPRGDLGGMSAIILDNPLFSISTDAQSGGGTTIPANRSFVIHDPHTYSDYYPLWQSNKWLPVDGYNDGAGVTKLVTNDGCPIIFKIDHLNNTLMLGIGTTLTSLGGSATVIESGGYINSGIFNSADTQPVRFDGAIEFVKQVVGANGGTAAAPMVDTGFNGSGIYFPSSGAGASHLNFSDGGTASGYFTGSALTVNGGIGSKSTTSAVQITSTGITNNMGVNAKVFLTATAVLYTNFNNAGTAYKTNTLSGTLVFDDILQPGGFIRAAAGLNGTIVPF